MATFVALTALEGDTIQINVDKVCGLVPLQASRLPSGVADGTVLTDSGGEQYLLQGTVAANLALLGGQSAINFLAFAVVNGATGAIVLQNGSIGVSAVHNGAGDYTVTFDEAPPADAWATVSLASGGPGSVTTNGPVGLNTDVLAFDDAGVAADQTFVIVLFA
jgi:hypothetical protein